MANNDGQSEGALPDGHVSVLHDRLEELRREVGAQCVLASTTAGALVAQAGVMSGLELEPLLRLATDNFASSMAMVRYLGGIHSGNLTYYEGASHDVYIANVQDDLFLLVVFDRRIQASRIGVVWLYVRRAVESLRRVTSSYPACVENKTSEVLEASEV
jgi:predicted regulator of Ras-like GTPase activity (Roadblock/LC7/MglB family)